MAARRMFSSLSRMSSSTASMTRGPPILPSASAARLRTDALDVDLAVHPLQRRQSGAADQLVGVPEQSLQRGLDFRRVEFGQNVDDVHARDGVLALHTADELRYRIAVGDLGDHPEERRF